MLLVDDSPLSREFQRELLREVGFEVRAAGSIIEFDEILENWSPDVVLTDYEMPDIDGSSLCRALKKRVGTSHVPVVLFSCLPDEELSEIAQACGADAFLSKQTGYDQLASKVSSLCESILW